jgi:hypothetical protein
MVQAYLPAFDDFMVNKCEKNTLKADSVPSHSVLIGDPSPFSEPQISYRYLYSYPIQHIPFTNGWCPLPFLSSFLIVKSDILNYISWNIWNIPAKKKHSPGWSKHLSYHWIPRKSSPWQEKPKYFFESRTTEGSTALQVAKWRLPGLEDSSCHEKTSLFSGSMEMVQWKISPVPYSEIPKNLL